MIFHLPRVCLCNRTRCVPAFPLAHPVPLHVPSMGVPVGPPVIRVGIPPSFLRVPAVLAVIGIIGHFLPVPSPLALPLTVPSGAISLFLHPRTRNEQPATRHTTTTSCHEAPPDHDWAIDASFLVQQGWVNSESTQTGGSVFQSTGGSILESVKAGLASLSCFRRPLDSLSGITWLISSAEVYSTP